MSARYSKATLVYAVLLVSLVLGSAAIAEQQHPARKHPVKKERPVQPAPPPPPAPAPPPPTLEQMPAVPPQVSFSNGLLTIVAENSTLADILRAVRTKTGAVVEIPSNATERVVIHLGPGPARSVLTSLLNGSHFNYVMLGSPTNPDKVDRLVLTSKTGGTPDVGAPPAPTAQQNDAAAPVNEPDEPQADMSEQPGAEGDENSAQESQQQQPNGLPPVKTPEQLLRELQQQQLQQQQQQGQQPPSNPPPR